MQLLGSSKKLDQPTPSTKDEHREFRTFSDRHALPSELDSPPSSRGGFFRSMAKLAASAAILATLSITSCSSFDYFHFPGRGVDGTADSDKPDLAVDMTKDIPPMDAGSDLMSDLSDQGNPLDANDGAVDSDNSELPVDMTKDILFVDASVDLVKADLTTHELLTQDLLTQDLQLDDLSTPDLQMPDLLLPDLLLPDLQLPDLAKPPKWNEGYANCNTLTFTKQNNTGTVPQGHVFTVELDSTTGFDFGPFVKYDPSMSTILLQTGDCDSQLMNPGMTVPFGVLPDFDVNKGKATILIVPPAPIQDQNKLQVAMMYNNSNAPSFSNPAALSSFYIDVNNFDPKKVTCKAQCVFDKQNRLISVTNPQAQSVNPSITSVDSFGLGNSVVSKVSFAGSKEMYDAWLGFYGGGGNYSVWVYEGPGSKFFNQTNTVSSSDSFGTSSTDNKPHVYSIGREQSDAIGGYDGNVLVIANTKYPLGMYPVIIQLAFTNITANVYYMFVNSFVANEPTLNISPTETQ